MSRFVLMSSLSIVVLASCISGGRVARTAFGVNEDREMGQLLLNILVKKSVVKKDKIFLNVNVTIDGPNPIVLTHVYKIVNGKELFIGNTDGNGSFSIITSFSCPDTFSFVSPSYQKKYLYVGTNCK